LPKNQVVLRPPPSFSSSIHSNEDEEEERGRTTMKHCPPHATRTAGFASLILRVGERYTLKFASSAACVGLNRGPSQFSLRKTLREPASPSSNNVAVVKKSPACWRGAGPAPSARTDSVREPLTLHLHFQQPFRSVTRDGRAPAALSVVVRHLYSSAVKTKAHYPLIWRKIIKFCPWYFHAWCRER
jgi:hypothetical protein